MTHTFSVRFLPNRNIKWWMAHWHITPDRSVQTAHLLASKIRFCIVHARSRWPSFPFLSPWSISVKVSNGRSQVFCHGDILEAIRRQVDRGPRYQVVDIPSFLAVRLMGEVYIFKEPGSTWGGNPWANYLWHFWDQCIVAVIDPIPCLNTSWWFFCYDFQWPNRAFFFCKKLFAAVSKRYYELAQMNIVAWVSATWICPTGIMELCHAGSMSCCSKLWHKESYISMNHVLYIHQIKHGHGDGTLIVWRVGCLGPGPLASCRPPFKPIRPNYK